MSAGNLVAREANARSARINRRAPRPGMPSVGIAESRATGSAISPMNTGPLARVAAGSVAVGKGV